MLKTSIPQSKELQKYIEVFYVFNSDKPAEFKYIAFPHTGTGLSFFSGVSLKRNDFEVFIEPSKNTGNTYSIEILGKYTKPVFVHYHGDFEEVSIVFKPLGVNRFFKNDLIEITPEYSQPLTIPSWLQFSPALFEKQENRITRLEDFLLTQLHEPNRFTEIEKALPYLEKPEFEYSITEVAELLNMSPKTFQRHFLKHLTCSPSEYKRIARFRNSLNARLLSKQLKSLTTISYENNYSDQSYFIREFKKLSNSNPKSLFNKISLLDNEKIFWEIK